MSFNNKPNTGDIQNAPYKIRHLAAKYYVADPNNIRELSLFKEKREIEKIVSNIINGKVSCSIDSMFYYSDTNEGSLFWAYIEFGLYNRYFDEYSNEKIR